MAIRSAIPADIAQMHRLEQQAPLAAHWSREQYEAFFSPNAPSRLVIVATYEPKVSQIIGFLVASYLTEEWELESVVVDEAARRRGVATALVAELVDRAGRARAQGIILEVRESNAAARQLYEKVGFIEQTRRKDYYQGPLEHAIVYRLLLPPCDKIP